VFENRVLRRIFGHKRDDCIVRVGKPEWKTIRVRPGLRSEDDIRMNLKKIGWKNVDWIQLAQYRDQWRALVNM